MSDERYSEEEKKEWRREGKEGQWEDATDLMEASPEFDSMMEDENIDFLKEHNPELLEIMKQAGLNDGSDERTTEED